MNLEGSTKEPVPPHGSGEPEEAAEEHVLTAEDFVVDEFELYGVGDSDLESVDLAGPGPGGFESVPRLR